MSNEPYPEQDKLGPLGVGIADGKHFGPTADLRGSIITAFRAAIEDADTAAQIASIDEAIHEVRKALRRARAIKALVGATLPRDDRRDLRAALVEARRTLSTARDLDVLPRAVDLCPEPLREAGTAVVAAARAGVAPVEQTREMIEATAERVTPLGDLIAAAIPATLDWGDLSDGLAATYRRARRSLRRARRSTRAFHAFRKRAKELTYQLELFADGIDGKVETMRQELEKLNEELGDAVDVLLLRGVASQHAADDAAFLDGLDGELRSRIKAARRRGKEIFDRSPRKFARRVRRAVRRDHEPSPAPEPVAQA